MFNSVASQRPLPPGEASQSCVAAPPRPTRSRGSSGLMWPEPSRRATPGGPNLTTSFARKAARRTSSSVADLGEHRQDLHKAPKRLHPWQSRASSAAGQTPTQHPASVADIFVLLSCGGLTHPLDHPSDRKFELPDLCSVGKAPRTSAACLHHMSYLSAAAAATC